MNRYWFFPDNSTVFLNVAGGTYSPVSTLPRIVLAYSKKENALYRLLPEPAGSAYQDRKDEVFTAMYPIEETIESWEPVSRRQAAELLPHDLFHEMNRAFHFARWHADSRFCGRCGAPTVLDVAENAKHCERCGFHSYPRISPAVIFAVVRDGMLLMAHGKNRTGNMYSVLAGFVEPGENLEQCVAREAQEEVGVQLRNITYFASQPWSFPDSLMVAFTAEWAGGEITPDPVEISDAGWYRPEALPAEIPGRLSVSRMLIEWFLSRYGTSEDLRRYT